MKRKPAAGSQPREPDDAREDLPNANASARQTWRQALIPLGLLVLLTLALFADVLFTSQNLVLSNRDTDLSQQFIHWRAFGFGELRRGNLALWNPHLFSGAPFFGGFQSALLYPPNALFLVLPLDKALNWSIALHVFLAGAFTYAWAAKRGLRPAAGFLAAAVFMFCGANFLHIYAGHLPNLCAFVWAPLVFLAIDGLAETSSPGWSLLGMFALAMQILAGHPQYVFYTGVAAALYSALYLFKVEKTGRFVLGAAGIIVGGGALSAVQLLTGLQESHETLRNVGVPYHFAAMFSFPPENFLTLLAPDLYGDMKTVPYWGRCYGWEMSLFMGVSTFALALTGAVLGERRTRRFSLTMIALLLLLALGAHTPLFKLLYSLAPGFNKFRGNSKFIFLSSLFLALLAGIGFNELSKGRRPPRLLAWGMGGAGLLLLAGAWWTHPMHPAGADPTVGAGWRSLVLAIHNTQESYLPLTRCEDPSFLVPAARMASWSLLIGGVTAGAVALLLLLGRRKTGFVAWTLLAMAVIELVVFARKSLDHFDLAQAIDPTVKQWLETHPGDYRIFNFLNANAALSLNARDIWGYDPAMIRRYAEFLALTQDIDPDSATQYLLLRHDHPLLDLLRCRFVFAMQNNQLSVYERTNCLPHLLLVQHCRVLGRRNDIFSALTSPAFDPRREVILENTPTPEPVPSDDPGTVKLVDSSTDTLTIEADLQSPGILLVTDTYAEGWHARPLTGSVQASYTVMPADYCLRGIPLAAGKHNIRLEYRPSGYRLGKWISILSAGLFLLLPGSLYLRRVRQRIG